MKHLFCKRSVGYGPLRIGGVGQDGLARGWGFLDADTNGNNGVKNFYLVAEGSLGHLDDLTAMQGAQSGHGEENTENLQPGIDLLLDADDGAQQEGQSFHRQEIGL